MIGVIASRHRQTRFVSTWNVATDNELVTLPISKLYKIDWGDGTTTTDQTSHTYASSGTYQIKIAGVVDDWGSGDLIDRSKVLTVDNWGGFVPSIFSFFFYGNLTSVSGGLKLTSNVTSFLRLCNSLNSDIINFDFSSTTIVSAFLRDSTSFNGRFINPIGTSSINDWSRFFQGATSFNQDISHLDFSGAKNLDLFMSGKSSANYDYQYYDNLLIKWNQDLDVPNMTNKTVDMGTIKRSLSSQTAYDSLTAKMLIISDGGLI